MEDKINQIKLRKTSYAQNMLNNKKRYYSPNLLNKNFIKYFYLSEHFLKSDKINQNIKHSKSTKRSKKNSKSQKNKSKSYTTRRIYERKNDNKNFNQNITKIIKKITYHPNFPKKMKYKEIRNIPQEEKDKRLTTLYSNKLEMNPEISLEQNKIKKKNYIWSINLNDIKNKKETNNYRKNRNKKLVNFPSKKICFSLDNILSKKKVNKTKTKTKTNSFDNKNIIINNSPKIRLKNMENKLNSEKIKRQKKYIMHKTGQIKSENMTKVIINNRTKKINEEYYKSERKSVNVLNNVVKNIKSNNYSRENSNNNSKLLSDNISTNYKSLHSRRNLNSSQKEKQKMNLTPNINIEKNKTRHNKINSCKNTEREHSNNNYKIFEFTIDNEKNERINGVKINNFDVNKPKEENLKFTFAKEEKESDMSVSCASKVIIGKIDGYKDIIENDQKNNHFRFNTNLYNKTLNKLNIYNTYNNNNKDQNKKIPTKEDSITFNEDEFSDNFNISNNLDGISTKTNNKNGIIKVKYNYEYNKDNDYLKSNKKSPNKINKSLNSISFSINTDKSFKDFSKIVNYEVINTEEFKKKEKEEKKGNSDNCLIF